MKIHNSIAGAGGITYFFENDDGKLVRTVKVPKYADPIPWHESEILDVLNKHLEFLPYFSHDYCVQISPIDNKFRRQYTRRNKQFNPFVTGDNAANADNATAADNAPANIIWKPVLSTAYIDGEPFDDEPLGGIELYSYLQQTLLFLMMSQQTCDFVHYDLHTDNILIRRDVFKSNDILVVVLDESNQFVVPTAGICPYILDFEYAYTKESNPFLCNFDQTAIGYTPNVFDKYSDARMLLTAVSSTKLDDTHDDYEGKKLYNITFRCFGRLCCMTRGWTQAVPSEDTIISQLITNIENTLDDTVSTANILAKYPAHLLHTLQGVGLDMEDAASAAAAPELNPITLNDILIEFSTGFAHEFYILYALQWLADSTRINTIKYTEYITPNMFIDVEAYDAHMSKTEEYIHKLSPWCRQLRQWIDYHTKEYVNTLQESTQGSQPLQHLAHLFGIIEANMMPSWSYKDGQQIIFFDILRGKRYTSKMNRKLAKYLNTSMPRMCTGAYLYDLAKRHL